MSSTNALKKKDNGKQNSIRSLIITDNPHTLAFARELETIHGNIDIFQSEGGCLDNVPALNIGENALDISQNYQIVISLHCKQLFGSDLIKRIRCINVHPGFNPFNRGWFPHVFSIMNGMKAGATIHEIDERLDHGAIIVQKEYEIKPWDTSESAYLNILKIEKELLFKNFESIRDGTYHPEIPKIEGNLNCRDDYNALKRLDLEKYGCFGDFLNQLRALTHGQYHNAYFLDHNGKKVFVKIHLEPEA